MKVLIVPMFALSSMGGPWSRAQKIASAFMDAGHEVVLGFAEDGNCKNPVTERTLELPVPSPLGLPMAIASRTFPIANKLGITGRKPVRSFEEVLWLTGALAYAHERESIETIRCFIRAERPDLVYSEFSLPAIIAAKAEGVPCVGTASFPTQPTYASAPEKAKGVRRILDELELPNVTSSLELFARMERRFVPSCPTLELLEGKGIVYCGFLTRDNGMATTSSDAMNRDALVLYLGSGSVPPALLEQTARELANATGLVTYLAGIPNAESDTPAKPGNPSSDEGRLRIAQRFDFDAILPRARAFVNHGGQNSVMDALAYGVPQVIVPGKVFERRYNAESIEAAHAGIRLDEFSTTSILAALNRIENDEDLAKGAQTLREELASLGGSATIVAESERLLEEYESSPSTGFEQ